MFSGRNVFGFVGVGFFGAALFASGCSDPEPARSRVMIAASFSGKPSAQCGVTPGVLVNIRNPTTTGNFEPVYSGDSIASTGQPVTVNCRVTPSGDGFEVALFAQGGGGSSVQSITIEGRLAASGTAQNIHGSLVTTFGPFDQRDCTVTLKDPPPEGGAIARGRVWGMLYCPTLTNKDQKVNGQDRVCDATTEFRFENCSQ